jgi:hypothetical protein
MDRSERRVVDPEVSADRGEGQGVVFVEGPAGRT